MSSEKKNKFRPWDRFGIRFKLVSYFLVVFGVIFSLFSAGMYHYISEVHRREFDAALNNYVVDLGHSLDDELLAAKVPTEFRSDSEMILPFSLGETLLQVSNSAGQIVIRSKNLENLPTPFPPPIYSIALEERASFSDIRIKRAPDSSAKENHFRLVSHAFHRQNLGDFVVQAAVPMILLERQHEGLLMFLALTVPLALALAGLAGLLFSRRAMGPVGAIIEKANEIEARRLSERIPVPESRDEIHELALTLNGLLDRLERSFKSQEEFVADASHQLKTPLAILKGELEIFSKQEHTAEDLGLFLESAKQEVNDLTHMVEDLLTLAHADRYGIGENKTRFRIDEKLMESVSRFSRYAEKRAIRLSVDLHPNAEVTGGSFEIEGEPELVRSMIENLLDNAIKYSPEGTTVAISLEEKDKQIKLRVVDQGPGISKEALPNVFKRFYRSDSVRSTVSGSGLGLSLVQKIAEIHGGAVSAESSTGGGSIFTLELPRQC